MARYHYTRENENGVVLYLESEPAEDAMDEFDDEIAVGFSGNGYLSFWTRCRKAAEARVAAVADAPRPPPRHQSRRHLRRHGAWLPHYRIPAVAQCEGAVVEESLVVSQHVPRPVGVVPDTVELYDEARLLVPHIHARRPVHDLPFAGR